MKKTLEFIAFVCLFLLASCKPDIPEKLPDTLEVSPLLLEFAAEDYSKQIVSVTTSIGVYKIEQSVDWITTGVEADRFVVAVKANDVIAERTGTITVTSGDAEPVAVTVKQAAGVDKTPVLEVNITELELSDLGSVLPVEVTTNVGDWLATPSADWIVLDRQGDSLMIAATRNWLNTERIASVTVTAGAPGVLQPVTITVTQSRYSADWSADPALRELKAFPGAEGFGAATTGGRGGKVLYVTTLEDHEQPGSLRWAVNQSGKRIILFKVSGNIILQDRLGIKRGDVTIAGHSAPGDGICLQGYDVTVDASNVIIRYMRFRMGDLNNIESDALWGRYQNNVIIDHCSMSWSVDEVASFYDNQNFTMQWCILSESMRISKHEKGAHGYGAIWGGKNASYHHNLLAHHDSRNPRFSAYTHNGADKKTAGLVDFRNNVIYNWGNNSGYAGEGGRYNMVNNYYQPGTESRNNARIFAPGADTIGIYGTFYVHGNIMMMPSTFPNRVPNREVTDDNWVGIHTNVGADVRSDTEFDKGTINTHTAQEAYELVLDRVGASYRRDAIDTRVINEVRYLEQPVRASAGGDTKPGLIDSHTDVGGWCLLESLPAPTDSDSDGMPDEWETLNGLSPNNAADGTATNLSGGTYTNLEVYLYDLLKK